MKRWFKMPCLMHQRGYITLPASARGVLVTIKDLLSSEPVLCGNMNAFFRWTGIDRHTLKKSFEALQELGLLSIEQDEKGEYTITDPASSSTKVTHELHQGSTKVSTELPQSSTKVTTKLHQGYPKVAPNLTTQESSNDAGLEPANLPLEENRIDKNRKEEKRIEAQSAADKPHNSPSQKVKKTTTIERPADCDETVWRDWLRVRGRNPLTQTAWSGMTNEASKAGISPAEAVRICAERGWRGFRADWLDRDKPKRGGWEPEDLDNQDYRSHDGEEFVAGSAAEYFFGREAVRAARERYSKPYDRSKEELA